MFRPFACFIGLRYTRAKRRTHFVSFISTVSMLGIALGVAVLITVLSVMNGFDGEIKHRVFGVARQVSVMSLSGHLKQWQILAEKFHADKSILAEAPFVEGQGLLSINGGTQAVMVTGILPRYESKLSVLAKKMVDGKLSDLAPKKFGMVIGERLANNLGLTVGDKVNLVVPQVTVSPLGVMPTYKAFTVAGVFNVGNGFGFDSSLVFIHLNDAQALFRMNDAVTGLRLKIHDVFEAPVFSRKLQARLPGNLVVHNWTEQYGALFNAIGMEKNMMFLALMLIVAVAAFNLVCSLVMTVTDKQADIAILKTFGATPKTILSIFMVQGTVVSIFGVLLGVIGGVLLTENANAVVAFIQTVFHITIVSPDVYYLNYLPTSLHMSDVVRIIIMTLGLGFLATIYPAWSASRVQPAEALRYE